MSYETRRPLAQSMFRAVAVAEWSSLLGTTLRVVTVVLELAEALGVEYIVD